MTDGPGSTSPGDDSGMPYEREPATGVPRWVKIAAIVVALAALVVVVVLLSDGGGGHGPARHAPGGTGEDAPPSDAPAVHTPPADSHG